MTSGVGNLYDNVKSGSVFFDNEWSTPQMKTENRTWIGPGSKVASTSVYRSTLEQWDIQNAISYQTKENETPFESIKKQSEDKT